MDPLVSAFLDYVDAHFSIERTSGDAQIKLAGTCPFCGETRDDLRLYFNSKTTTGVCFHCGKAFNAITFVAAAEGVENKQARAILKGYEEGFARSEDEPAPAATGIIFPQTVPVADSPEAKSYLDGRGIGQELIDHFGLAYCPFNTERPDGSIMWSQGRVFIPIHDLSGECVSWQARDIRGRSAMKYLFPRGFEGAEYVYNAWAIARGAPYLVVTEGVMGAFGWWRAGFTNVVATFGKKCSKPQLEILRLLAPKVLIMAWDTDALWQSHQFCRTYAGFFPEVRLADMGGRDADEMTKTELADVLRRAAAPRWEDMILAAL